MSEFRKHCIYFRQHINQLMDSIFRQYPHFFVCIILLVISAKAQTDLTDWQKKATEARKLLNAQPREALKIAQLYLEAATADRNEWAYADAHYLMGQCHLSLDEYPTAFHTLQKGINYLNSKNELPDNFLTLKADMLQAIGTIYRMWGMWPEATEAYAASIAIDRAQQNQYNIARTLSNMGVLFEKMGDTLQSINHYQQGLAIAGQINDKQLQATALGHIGIYYKNRKNYLLSLKFQLQSLNIKKQINDLRGVANSLGNLAITYSKQQKYTEALTCAHQTRVIYEGLSNTAMITHTMAVLGDLHLGNNQIDSAVYYLQKSFKEARRQNLLKVMQESSEDLYQIHLLHNDFKKALEYKVITDSINRIFFNREKQQLTEQAKARYALQQQQSEIERLRWESQLQEMDNERQARIIRLLGQEAKMTEVVAEKRQLELSLLSSQKKLLEQKQENAAQQLKKQAAELQLQKLQNNQNKLQINLQTQQIAYNRLLIFTGICLFLFAGMAAYLVIRRIRQRLQRNQRRHMQTIDEIAYINSHHMRAPVATLLGLMNLIKMDMEQGVYNPYLLNLVDKTAQNIDDLVRQVSDRTNQISTEEKEQESIKP